MYLGLTYVREGATAPTETNPPAWVAHKLMRQWQGWIWVVVECTTSTAAVFYKHYENGFMKFMFMENLWEKIKLMVRPALYECSTLMWDTGEHSISWSELNVFEQNLKSPIYFCAAILFIWITACLQWLFSKLFLQVHNTILI